MAKVRLDKICKSYDREHLAVKDFTLEIEDKEFVVLVGPSGCGKSTTLRMIAGLEDISTGELYIGDRLVNRVEPKDRDIAMVFQSYALYPHMTVYDNMAFSLQLHKMPKNEIAQKVDEAARILGIEELLQRKPKQLSGGQRQRVAIGRAIVRHPKVFLMDEPLSNLDAKLRNKMRAELVVLRRKIDTTFVYVTHDQVEAMTLGDRIVVMNEGEIQQIGTPEQVFTRPQNLFVAEFIGSPKMNLFRNVRLELEDGNYHVAFEGKRLEVDPLDAKALYANKQQSCDIILGVRPEHLVICDETGGECFGTPVDVFEMLGSESYIHTKLGGSEIVIRAETTARSFEMQKQKGGQVCYRIMNDNMHIFDAETGENLLIERKQIPLNTQVESCG
ncbi:sn-glycerol-3-phosphate ABC transporter ATP-binding protein UgpC [Christensenellaceae bacterium OttesenSCG-928-K19]|nr:sn-glycerol-3-phosphate ABC transporter ATP-binding protein UgpC [Christensenellaceae bacterium OttesenSCG-928-K19]